MIAACKLRASNPIAAGTTLPLMRAALRPQACQPHPAALPPSPCQAFAAAWQDDTRLLVGTKCNKLLQVSCTPGR